MAGIFCSLATSAELVIYSYHCQNKLLSFAEYEQNMDRHHPNSDPCSAHHNTFSSTTKIKQNEQRIQRGRENELACSRSLARGRYLA